MRKKLLLIFLLCLPHLLGHAADILVYDLRVENLTNPLGLDASSPRFSWKIRLRQEEYVADGLRDNRFVLTRAC